MDIRPNLYFTPFIFILSPPYEQRAEGRGGGGRCQTSFFCYIFHHQQQTMSGTGHRVQVFRADS